MSDPKMIKCTGCREVMDLESWIYRAPDADELDPYPMKQGHCPKCDGTTFHEIKPLFLPLKAEYFDAFERGIKRLEYRRAGKRFNDRSCFIGRDVVLSRGYGKARRLTGRITSFTVDESPLKLPGWVDCYGSAQAKAAVIGIELHNR